jgi:hypothetical protein
MRGTQEVVRWTAEIREAEAKEEAVVTGRIFNKMKETNKLKEEVDITMTEEEGNNKKEEVTQKQEEVFGIEEAEVAKEVTTEEDPEVVITIEAVDAEAVNIKLGVEVGVTAITIKDRITIVITITLRAIRWRATTLTTIMRNRRPDLK